MLEIFNNELTTPNQNQIHFYEFENIKATFLTDLININQFYNDRVYAIKNNNFLVRLLTNLDVPMSYSVDRFVTVASARAPYVATGMRMTSELSKGIFHNGCFYGQETLEIILNDTDYFNPFFAEKNWRKISAIKVLLQPKSDLNLLLPNGKQSSNGGGLAVISINIPLLAVQYRSFCLEQIARMASKGSLLGITHFIHMYVLPSMLYSQTDTVVMNRLMNLFYGKPQNEAFYRHPFSIHSNYANKMDLVLNKILKNIDGKTLRYETILETIPGISEVNMLDALAMPDITPTLQVLPALMLSRLEIMSFLIDVGGINGKKINRDSITKLQRTLFGLNNNNLFETLPKSMLFDVQETIKKIMSI